MGLNAYGHWTSTRSMIVDSKLSSRAFEELYPLLKNVRTICIDKQDAESTFANMGELI
jgi:hypothetical protein